MRRADVSGEVRRPQEEQEVGADRTSMLALGRHITWCPALPLGCHRARLAAYFPSLASTPLICTSHPPPSLSLQGIELRLPALTVQLPPPGSGAAAAAARVPPSGAAVAAASPLPVGTPALLTITMRVAIVQLPPLDMKF